MAIPADIKKLLKPDSESVWDKTVPIILSGTAYHCYLADDISTPDDYNELCYIIDNATANNKIYLHINTSGGYIDSAFKVVSSIKRTKAKVIARLTGTVASAGTIIALSCDDVEVEDYVSFMVHNWSGGASGKGHEIKSYIAFADKMLTNTFGKLYKGFLTPRELSLVIKGNDMWMGTEEVKTRWAKLKETNK